MNLYYNYKKKTLCVEHLTNDKFQHIKFLGNFMIENNDCGFFYIFKNTTCNSDHNHEFMEKVRKTHICETHNENNKTIQNSQYLNL